MVLLSMMKVDAWLPENVKRPVEPVFTFKYNIEILNRTSHISLKTHSQTSGQLESTCRAVIFLDPYPMRDDVERYLKHNRYAHSMEPVFHSSIPPLLTITHRRHIGTAKIYNLRAIRYFHYCTSYSHQHLYTKTTTLSHCQVPQPQNRSSESTSRHLPRQYLLALRPAPVSLFTISRPSEQ
jgi:carotenoid cleavage dioxygenase-like enzyme